jgi:hypothetical protein
MKLRDMTGHISTPARIITVLTIVLIAVVILQAIVQGGVVMLLSDSRRARPAKPELTEPQARQKRIRESLREFLPDGTSHLIHTAVRTDYRQKSLDEVEVYDAHDNLVWSGKRKDLPYAYIKWSYRPGTQYFGGLGARALNRWAGTGVEFSRQLAIPITSAAGEVIERWRYDREADVFAGYDSDQRPIGYWGSQGLTPSESQARPFGQFVIMYAWWPKDSPSVVLLWQTKTRVYQIDFAERTMDILFDLPGEAISKMAVSNWQSLHENAQNRPSIYVVTKSGKCHILLRDPTQRLQFDVPEDFNSRTVNIAAPGDKVFLRYLQTKPRYTGRGGDPKAYMQWWEEHRDHPRQRRLELRQVDESGIGPLVGSFDWTTPPRRYDPTARRRARLMTVTSEYVTALSPPAYNLGWYLYYKDAYRSRSYFSTWTINNELAQVIMRYQPQRMTLNWVLSLAMVGVVFWHGWARRTSWAKFVFWLVFVGLFNLAGLLTYWALNHTPVIRCAACGKKRSLRIPTCRACKAELTPPAPRDVDLILTPTQ